jgi:hypothetical protein
MTPTTLTQQRRAFRQPVASPFADSIAMDQPSLDEWIVGQLEQRGFQPLEQLASPLRQVNWSELFLAIDRLVRAGRICLWPASSGDVVLSVVGRGLPPSNVPTNQLAGVR